jgi:hypothetical protein
MVVSPRGQTREMSAFLNSLSSLRASGRRPLRSESRVVGARAVNEPESSAAQAPLLLKDSM